MCFDEVCPSQLDWTHTESETWIFEMYCIMLSTLAIPIYTTVIPNIANISACIYMYYVYMYIHYTWHSSVETISRGTVRCRKRAQISFMVAASSCQSSISKRSSVLTAGFRMAARTLPSARPMLNKKSGTCRRRHIYMHMRRLNYKIVCKFS